MIKRLWHQFIYKPGTKKLYWEKIVTSSIVLVSFIVWAFLNQGRVNKLEKNRNKFSKYTVGITTASYNNVKGGRYIHYKYFILGKEYSDSKGWPLIDNSVYTKGGHYLVIYDSTDFSNSEIFFTCPVPSSIEPPNNGWSIKPFSCDEK